MRKSDLGLPEDPPMLNSDSGEPITPDDVKSLARRYTVESIRGLYEIASNEDNPASARLAAYTALLDRGHGRVVNEVPVAPTNQYNTQIINVTDEALRLIPQEKLLELRARVQADGHQLPSRTTLNIQGEIIEKK